VASQEKTGAYITASLDELLSLFDADCGIVSISNEAKVLGKLDNSREATVILEYLRIKKVTSVMTSHHLVNAFPELIYKPGFSSIAGFLLVPLTSEGQDFIVFFRKPVLSVGFSVPQVNLH
jgi:light-regulated signal transduction histidine kinase (bacteriophytochrome)